MKSGYVAIIGRPNVGKSTLLNRLIGEELAIISPKPQTTRHKIIGICNRPGAQAVFLDTPGFHKSEKPLNKMMLEKVDEAAREADVIVLVVEPGSSGPTELDMEIYKRCGGGNVIIAINKIDTVLSEPWGNVVDRFWQAFGEKPTVAISATRGDGCETLLNKIVELLPKGEPFYPDDQYTEHPVRFLVSEIIREQSFGLLRQELPYSLTVEVDEFKEASPDDAITRIRASIIVEKDSQKGIVVGASGQMIKKIGTLARQKIEKLLGTKVFLELHVKVIEGWTKDPTALKRLGYD